jgi:hypothetical protein
MENENNTQEKNQAVQEKSPSLAKSLADAARSRLIKVLIIGVLALVVLFGVFGLGLAVGYRKANFSYQWGENYHTVFGGPQGGFIKRVSLPGPMMGGDFINSHGTTGFIIKKESNNLVVDGNNAPEKVIVVSDRTIIRRGQQAIRFDDLKVGELTVTIGNPDAQGRIQAELIRAFGAPQR